MWVPRPSRAVLSWAPPWLSSITEGGRAPCELRKAEVVEDTDLWFRDIGAEDGSGLVTG